jgi:hypothetical protein
VDYSLVKKDIVKILTWMDSDSMTPAGLAAMFRGENCANRFDSCAIVVHQTTPGESSLEGLSGISSEQYIEKVMIETSNQRDISYARVQFNDRYRRGFSVESFYQILFPNQVSEVYRGSDTHCDGPCSNPRRSQSYKIDIKNKYFPNSDASKKYLVSVAGKYLYNTKKFSPREIVLQII